MQKKKFNKKKLFKKHFNLALKTIEEKKNLNKPVSFKYDNLNKKNIDLYIKFLVNNIIITVINSKNKKVLATFSTGLLNFKTTREKRSYIAIRTLGIHLSKVFLRSNVRKINKVFCNGFKSKKIFFLNPIFINKKYKNKFEFLSQKIMKPHNGCSKKKKQRK